MAEGNTTSPAHPQEELLDFLLDTAILSSTLDDRNKNAYLCQLEDIFTRLDGLNSASDWKAFGDWRRLSEEFYRRTGVEGRVVGSWGVEEQVSDLTGVIRRMGMGDQTMKGIGDGEAEREIDEMLEKLLDERDRVVEKAREL